MQRLLQILFHFFLSVDGQIVTRQRLASLVRVLFRRRDLASKVRSLVLWTPDDDELLQLSHQERLACAVQDADEGRQALAGDNLTVEREEEMEQDRLADL